MRYKMKIIYLGWGSLLWSNMGLSLSKKWEKTDIKFPLNFSRISDKGKGRLTLVVDYDNGINNNIWYAETKHNDLNKAIKALKERENTIKRNIAYLNLQKNNGRVKNLRDDEQKMLIEKFKGKYDAIIWVDLATNWQDIRNEKYTTENAIKYLKEIKNDKYLYSKSLEYIMFSRIFGHIQSPLIEKIFSSNFFKK